MSESTGFLDVPHRYQTDSGREAIDVMRDSLTDEEFGLYCRTQKMRYTLRLGKKGETEEERKRLTAVDQEKADFYGQMERHIFYGEPDPRHKRPGFKPYERQAIPEPIPRFQTSVLDHGFLRLVEDWGGGDSRLQEAGIIEAARQSTQGAFRGWRRDRRLLQYLYENKHSTPFEFAGMTIEVRAPIMVFRQWHRHRTQSYNEASGRYIDLPELWYTPTLERVLMDGGANKQAGAAAGADELTRESAQCYLRDLEDQCLSFRSKYSVALQHGIPKELARLGMPLNWYTQMRATANLRNWLAFLTLRIDPHAQWEIRQFANALYQIVELRFPEVAKLFSDGR